MNAPTPNSDEARLRKWLTYLVSDEGMKKEAENPFTESIGKFKKVVVAQKKDLLKDEYLEKNKNVKLTPELDAQFEQQAREEMKPQLEKFRKQLVENGVAGYKSQPPIPMENVVGSMATGALSSAISGGGVTGGIMSGFKSAVTGFVMNLPFVGKFMRQLSNWAGAKFGGEQEVSWDDAGRLSEAQGEAAKVVGALKGYAEPAALERITTEIFKNPKFNPPEAASQASTNSAVHPNAAPGAIVPAPPSTPAVAPPASATAQGR